MQATHQIDAGVLNVGYADLGPADGPVVFLLHGFPYDIQAYVDVTPLLVQAGCRVIVPYLRGFGSTRFKDASTLRSGEQAALGADLLALMDALQIQKAVLAGYDWGGRAACVVAALWPERCQGLVSCNSYNIQNIARALEPAAPEREHLLWYQYYFHNERGRSGLEMNRNALTQLLWQQWSPTWAFTADQFARTAPSFDNPDFVDVVIHSYRHRYGLVAGDPAFAEIEQRLAAQPVIRVPSITFDGADDGVNPALPAATQALYFTGPRDHRIVAGAGHNVPQEVPEVFAQAVLELITLSQRA
ncbi:alpha/beta fold hydrolase [Limnohabitans sp. B9-3]|uniref:alpha/beta fold hydrolase n=1 Tax=Limnohabitans sp. B9-3 TaxID=1100707 RepID=UPI000C1EB45D|nr:alpha/beta hydrolase [Limnohabitans sp. B9-3]PIT74368.1 alpha/beta hydrolase [Limnohabitans sp. B9-3]